jgi:hypothetical protein
VNQYVFAARNVADKFGKIIRNPGMMQFYWQTYIKSRFVAIEPDIYIVSYPKCGRTWLRILLQQYLKLADIPTQQFTDTSLFAIPGKYSIKFAHDQGTWVPAPPRLKNLSFNRKRYRGKKVIFLVRDPRDVLVSSWYHLRYREHIYRDDLGAFVRDELIGIHKVIAFMNMWMDHRHIPQDFLLVAYEQMHTAPLDTAQKILAFLQLDTNTELVQRALDESSFENMKKMETSGSLKEPWMRPGTSGSNNALKVRKGKMGSFREELSEEDIAFVNQAIRAHLNPELCYHEDP